jgi:hypothetical protein
MQDGVQNRFRKAGAERPVPENASQKISNPATVAFKAFAKSVKK